MLLSPGAAGVPVIINQPLQQVGSPADIQYIPLTMTQPIVSPSHSNYTSNVRALPLQASQVVTRVTPPTIETAEGTSSATFIKEVEVEARYEIVPVCSPPTLPQTKAAPQMIQYEIPREPIADSREPHIRERRAPIVKEIFVEKERAVPPPERERAARSPSPDPVEEPEIIVRQHRIEVPVEYLRIIEKIVQVPVEQDVTRTVEIPVEKLIVREIADERTVERNVEVPVEKITQVPVERVVEVPVEISLEKRIEIEHIVEVPVERIVEYPVERVVQVKKEVLVEPKRVGLGLLLEQNLSSQDRAVIVKDVVPGYGADASGNVKLGDVILSIDGRSLSRLNLEQVKSLMLGNPGTRSTLEIMRNEQGPFKVDVTRTNNLRSPPMTRSSFG